MREVDVVRAPGVVEQSGLNVSHEPGNDRVDGTRDADWSLPLLERGKEPTRRESDP